MDGTLRWGYHTAGTVRGWTATKSDDGSWSLTATMEKVDTFRVAQRPLVFVAAHRFGRWARPIVDLTISDRAMTARLEK